MHTKIPRILIFLGFALGASTARSDEMPLEK
jgi:hypothetical protein